MTETWWYNNVRWTDLSKNLINFSSMYALKVITSWAILWSSDKVPSHAIEFCCPQSETYLESHFAIRRILYLRPICYQKNTIPFCNSSPCIGMVHVSTVYQNFVTVYLYRHWGRLTQRSTLLLQCSEKQYYMSFVAYIHYQLMSPWQSSCITRRNIQIRHCEHLQMFQWNRTFFLMVQVKYRGFICLYWLHFLFHI